MCQILILLAKKNIPCIKSSKKAETYPTVAFMIEMTINEATKLETEVGH